MDIVGKRWIVIMSYPQAYLGYYVASKLRFFTPGTIQGISCRGGYYLAVRCLPLNITRRYFILREWVHQYNGRGRGAIDLVYHGSPLLGQRQAYMDQRQYRRGLFRIGVSIRWVGDGQFYLSPILELARLSHADRVIWFATLSIKRGVRHGIIVDAYRASNSRVRWALWKALYGCLMTRLPP
jgi:hypothetical protein